MTISTDPKTKTIKISAEEILTNQLIEFFEKGNTFKKDWNTTTKGKLINCQTSAEYNGSNVVLLMMHQILGGYPHSIYCGFGQGKALKLKLKKGSKSARILMPILHSEDKLDPETKKPVLDLLGDPVKNKWTTFKTACVFNIDQFEDSEEKQKILDKFVSAPDAQVQKFKDHKPTEKLINSYIKRESIDVFFGSDSAYYTPLSDTVTMPSKEQFTSRCGFYGTYLHELIHSTGHQKRINRKTLTDPNTNRKSYATEELITELAAVNLTHELKISTVDKLQNSAAYLESWVKTLKADKKILFKLLTQSNKAIKYLKGDIKK
jgi:antirestriction protein ArdC